MLQGCQIGYASVGLCYSVEKTENRALLIPGNVSIANLSTIQTNTVIGKSDSIKAQQYTANRLVLPQINFIAGQTP